MTVVLAPFWLLGAASASLLILARWAWAAVTDGYTRTIGWKWAPALGAGLLALAGGTVVALW